MSQNHFGHRKRLPILMMIPPESGASGTRRSERKQISSFGRVSGRWEKWLPALVAEPPRVGRRCNRSASCPYAICEIGQCGGSGRLACDRKLLPPPARVAVLPMIGPYLDSIGSGHQASDCRLQPFPNRPNSSTDDGLARLSDKA